MGRAAVADIGPAVKTGARIGVAAAALATGLALGLALVGQTARARAAERRELWLATLRGPLELYLQASDRDARAVRLAPGPRRQRELADSAKGLRRAWTQAIALEPQWEADAYFYGLSEVGEWIGSAAQLGDSLAALDPRERAATATAEAAAQGIRRDIAVRVRQFWEQAGRAGTWSPDELRESRALVQKLEKAPI